MEPTVKKVIFVCCVIILIWLAPSAYVHAEDAPLPDPVLPSPTENLLIRSGDTILFDGAVSFPTAGSIDVVDSTGATHTIPNNTVLGFLYALDQTSDAFSLSDIEYYSSFDSLYLKCIKGQTSGELCDNWQYVIDGTTPSVGMDATTLAGGETIGIYFGSPHQVVLSSTALVQGEPLLATAETYNYLDNSWGPLEGVTIGATVPNPDDLYNPTVVMSQAVDSTGTASLLLPTPGTFTIGIAEDYYFPAYEVLVTIPEVVEKEGKSSGGSAPVQHIFDLESAVTYLLSTQDSDGSFGDNSLYTDWASIALATQKMPDDVRLKILGYMESHNSIDGMLTENERHTMALLALSQNPYAFHGTDYITPITQSFDGTQFGDASLVNDDIFALIPLLSAGYTLHDDIVVKDLQFIISKQRDDGSWEGSIDLTAAAIQVLSKVPTAKDALSAAETFLQSAQQPDGGWNSVYTTSWVLQAEKAQKAAWEKNGKDGVAYLGMNQSKDGGVLKETESVQNRIWATSYAIPAITGKTWGEIFTPVPRQELKESTPIVTAEKIKIITTQTIAPSPIEPPTINTPTETTQQNILLANVATSGTTIKNNILIGTVLVLVIALIFRFVKKEA